MPSIEIGGGAAELREQNVQREAKKPALARQRAERRTKGAGGDVHAVDRARATSRKHEGQAARTVDRGPVKRWRRAYSLPSFPDPPGYTLCWIARHRRYRGDEAGVLAALQEGWEFVKPEELDEDSLPTQSLAKHGEVIGNDSTVLMKLPNEFKAQRDAYFNDRRNAATRAVTKKKPGLAEATPQMPLVEDRNDISLEMPRMRARRKRDDAAE